MGNLLKGKGNFNDKYILTTIFNDLNINRTFIQESSNNHMNFINCIRNFRDIVEFGYELYYQIPSKIVFIIRIIFLPIIVIITSLTTLNGLLDFIRRWINL